MAPMKAGGDVRQPLSLSRGVRIPEMDGLRGMAILPVLLFHWQYFFGSRPDGFGWKTVVYETFTLGWVGVDLFFVLSGFLISTILLETRQSRRYFRPFYGRRALRILPLYYGFLALYFFIIPLLVDPKTLPGYEFELNWRYQWFYWTYLQNYMMAHVGKLLGALAPMWSLAVEEQFYILWPLLVRRSSETTLARLSLWLAAASFGARVAQYAAGWPLYACIWPTHCRLDGLAFGAWLAVAATRPGGLESWRPLAKRAVLVGSLFFGASRVFDRLYLLHTADTVGLGGLVLLFGGLLVLTVTGDPSGALRRLGRNAVLRFFGRHSYAQYVVHITVFGLVAAAGIDVPAVAGAVRWYGLAWAMHLALALGAVALVSWIIWHLLEAPLLRLKRRFPYHEP